MADHSVWVGCPASSAIGGRRTTRLRIGLPSATAMGDGKHRTIGVQDLGIASIASGRRGGWRRGASPAHVYC